MDLVKQTKSREIQVGYQGNKLYCFKSCNRKEKICREDAQLTTKKLGKQNKQRLTYLPQILEETRSSYDYQY